MDPGRSGFPLRNFSAARQRSAPRADCSLLARCACKCRRRAGAKSYFEAGRCGVNEVCAFPGLRSETWGTRPCRATRLGQRRDPTLNDVLGCPVEFLGRVRLILRVAFGNKYHHPLPRSSQQHTIGISPEDFLLFAFDGGPSCRASMAQSTELPPRLIPNKISTPAEPYPIQFQTLNFELSGKNFATKTRSHIGFFGKIQMLPRVVRVKRWFGPAPRAPRAPPPKRPDKAASFDPNSLSL